MTMQLGRRSALTVSLISLGSLLSCCYLFIGAQRVDENLFAKSVTAEAFHLKDAKGQRQAVLSTVDGETQLTLMHDNRTVVTLVVDEKGDPSFRFFGKAGDQRVLVGLHSDDVVIEVHDREKKTGFLLSSGQQTTVLLRERGNLAEVRRAREQRDD